MHQLPRNKLIRSFLQAFFLTGLFVIVPIAIAEDVPPAYDIAVASSAQRDQEYLSALKKLNDEANQALTIEQLKQFKALLVSKGWPTNETTGREGIDFAGYLLLRASAEFSFQQYMLELMDQQVDIDIDPAAYAHLSDLIYQQHADDQLYGTLLGIVAGKVAPVPTMTRYGKSRFFRDFYGLAPLDQEIEEAQKQVNLGSPIPQIYAERRLSKQPNVYSRPDIRESLGHMIADDQAARQAISRATTEKEMMTAKKRVAEVDKKNLPVIKSIFREVGFPTIAMVGRDGVSTAFLLVQHADDDLDFQRFALKLAKPLMEQRQLAKQQYAMLFDRVSLASGKPQLYGTQVQTVDGKTTLRPVEDTENLDARRKQMALGPIKDYLNSF
ncbi:DUF6624 domain-containing protein [uncultured Xanthomonas sp.]|uniref:DUF6624 domain-containing protein n=1 Tax=uncultured Xanthomonas sp. TaxID=152831 RepID=UPI0025D94CE7|nr:DUF6624 domain-containing protein [uncultured Xanthomonas sp.]